VGDINYFHILATIVEILSTWIPTTYFFLSKLLSTWIRSSYV